MGLQLGWGAAGVGNIGQAAAGGQAGSHTEVAWPDHVTEPVPAWGERAGGAVAEHSAVAGETDRACAGVQVWGGRGRWLQVWGGRGKALAVSGGRVYGMQMKPQALAVGEQLPQLPAASVPSMSK